MNDNRNNMRCIYLMASSLRNRFILFIGMLAIFAFFPSFHSVTRADHLPGVSKVLKSASELDYPPFAIVQPDGLASGFSVDLLKAAVEAEGLEISFKIGPWHKIKEELATGALDVLPLMSYSLERHKLYDFSAPYLLMSGAIFVRKDNVEIHQLSDLKGKEVLVMEGDTAHEYVVREKLTNTIIPTVSYEEAFKLLAAGKHDAVVVQQIVGLQLIKNLGLKNIVPVQKKNISSLKPITLKLEGFEQKFCFAVQEGNSELLSKLNEGLTVVYLNGTYERLYEKWFAPLLPKPQISPGEVLKNLLFILIPLLLIFALFGVWYLKRLVAKRTVFLEQEILQHKKATDALQKSEELLNEMGAIAKIGGWEHDLVTLQATWTQETFKIVEIESGPVPGPDEHLSYYPPEDRAILEKAYLRATENGVPFDLELQCTTAKGRLFWARAIGHPTFKGGKCIKMRGTFQDITERKKMEERLQQAQKLEAIGVLAGGIAHDFNNILSAILGFTELARMHYPANQQLNEDLTEIYTAGNRAKELVQQILTFSRRQKHTLHPLHVPTIIKEVVKLLRSTLPASIEMQLEIDENVRPVMADPTQVHQIVMNLCSNASQAMEDNGGILTIKLSEKTPSDHFFMDHPNLVPGNYIELTFQDTGVGIAPQMMGSIFDPYFTTKNNGDGTGLGLAVTYGIIQKMGGEIVAESEPGKGSVFTVFLPVAERGFKDANADNSGPSVHEQLRGNERILLVDDEDQILKLTTRILEKWGYQVTTAKEGQSALELFGQNPLNFDLVISDVAMPKLSGDKLAKQILAILPTMPILLASGYSNNISEESVMKVGVRGLLNKPVSEEQLLLIVRKVLDES